MDSQFLAPLIFLVKRSQFLLLVFNTISVHVKVKHSSESITFPILKFGKDNETSYLRMFEYMLQSHVSSWDSHLLFFVFMIFYVSPLQIQYFKVIIIQTKNKRRVKFFFN